MTPIRDTVPIRVGTVLRGHVDGWFGRDAWGPLRVEAIGADWVVARDDDGMPWFAFKRDRDVPGEIAEQQATATDVDVEFGG